MDVQKTIGWWSYAEKWNEKWNGKTLPTRQSMNRADSLPGGLEPRRWDGSGTTGISADHRQRLARGRAWGTCRQGATQPAWRAAFRQGTPQVAHGPGSQLPGKKPPVCRRGFQCAPTPAASRQTRPRCPAEDRGKPAGWWTVPGFELRPLVARVRCLPETRFSSNQNNSEQWHSIRTTQGAQ